MTTHYMQELLADIFCQSERPDKMTVRFDAVSRTVTIEYSDIDEQWFKELQERAGCQAVQRSDQMVCPCGLAWDVNDPSPPVCRGMP